MSKIIIDVSDNNLNTVTGILNNLKAGLINNIKVEKENKYKSKTAYKQNVLEDEFMPKKSASTTKYLSASDYKNKLKGK